MKQISWTQKFEFLELQSVKSLDKISLMWLLLQAHVQSSTVQIAVTANGYRFAVKIENGMIVSLIGVPELLSSIEIEMSPEMNLEMAIGQAMAKGVEYQSIIDIIVGKLGTQCAKVDREGKGTVGLSDQDFGMSVPLQANIPTILLKGLVLPEAELLRLYSPMLRLIVQKEQVDCKPSELSFPPELLRFFRDMKSGKRLKDVVKSETRVLDDWQKIHILASFYLISIQRKERKEVKRDPKAIEKYKKLKQEYREMKEMEPHILFGLKERLDVNDEVIGKKLRQLSLDYHPDRFVGDDSQIGSVVGEIYTFINEVHSKMQDEEYRKNLKERLTVEKIGEKYVSPEEKQKSELMYAQAKFLFNKRKFEDACEILDRAYAMDPYNWRLNVLRVKTHVKLGKMDPENAAEELLTQKDAKGHERVELLFQAGEFYFQAENSGKATQIFKQIVDLEEEHQGASRYLKRMERESESKKEEEKPKRFWGRLFGKK